MWYDDIPDGLYWFWNINSKISVDSKGRHAASAHIV